MHSATFVVPLCLSLCASATAQQFRTTALVSRLPLTWPTYDLAAGDVDGDGDVDLVAGNDHSPNQLLLNDGRGAFTDATAGQLTTPTGPPWPPSNATYEVDLADIDGDGDLDLLLVNDHFLPNRVHVNNGAGVFTDVSATALPPNAFYSTDQVVADFDGDGDVDWYVGDEPTPHLYFNNGAGVFTDVTATHLPPGLGLAQTCGSAADLDGDGDVDLLLPPIDYQTLTQVLLNQGAGTFALAPASYLPLPVTGPLAPIHPGFAADVDGDGLPDLLLRNGTILLRNLGGGQFADVSATALPANRPIVWGAADVDLDGDLDLVGNAAILRNDAPFVFTPVAGSGVGPEPALLFDLDGDLDPDIVSISSICKANFQRQLDATGSPRIGQNFALTVHAPPQSIVMLGAALQDTYLPIPGLGTLMLSSSTFVPLGTYGLSGPSLTLLVPVPFDANLVGLIVHEQALIADPALGLRLSNAIWQRIQ